MWWSDFNFDLLGFDLLFWYFFKYIYQVRKYQKKKLYLYKMPKKELKHLKISLKNKMKI